MPRNNTGFKGVYAKVAGRYQSEIRVPGKGALSLGTFTDVHAAARTFAKAYLEIHGEPPKPQHKLKKNTALVQFVSSPREAVLPEDSVLSELTMDKDEEGVDPIRDEDVSLEQCRSDSSTGYKGVYLKDGGRYQAEIQEIGSDVQFLGMWDTAELAAMAYAKAAL